MNRMTTLNPSLAVLLILLTACTKTPVPKPTSTPGPASPGFALVINAWRDGESIPRSFETNADGVHDALTRSGFDTVYVGPARDSNPDRDRVADMADIRMLLRQKSTELKPGQTLIIYVTGHGGVVEGTDEGMIGNLVTESNLQERLSQFSPGVRFIVILDACCSGSFANSLSKVAHQTITSSGGLDNAYADDDSDKDPNPKDEGGEFTSGLVETWNELLGDADKMKEIQEEADRTGRGFWEVFAGRAFEGAVKKDASYLQGLTSPQNIPGRMPTPKRPTLTPTATRPPTITPAPPRNRTPLITKFSANFVAGDRTTYYQVSATDPDGDPLTYEWSISGSCGTFNWKKTDSTAGWFHPHPPCQDERYHPAIITVTVRDSKGATVTYHYPGGSASATIVLIATPP